MCPLHSIHPEYSGPTSFSSFLIVDRVVAKEVEGRVGTDFLVKYKAKTDEKLACTYVFGSNYFEIKNEWAEYFAGLKEPSSYS